MISVNQARQLVQQNCKSLLPQRESLLNAVGLCIAEAIYSPINIPAFHQSAMDGYALCLGDYNASTGMAVFGQSQAGGQPGQLKPNTAMRIFTGAPIPAGADTVVIQEHTELVDNFLYIKNNNIAKAANIRKTGSEIAIGNLAIQANTMLTPAAIGLLAALGLAEIVVVPRPRISIIITGNELQKPGTHLAEGQVFESNSAMLHAALTQLGITQVNIQQVDDDLELLKNSIQLALQHTDLLLITGGVSVGNYDLTIPAATACGVNAIFHKVKQKPGKPLFFGKKDDCIVFGLPGNPASVLICFYQYVSLALQKIMNLPEPMYQQEICKLAAGYTKPAGLTHFLKGNFYKNMAAPTLAQESFRLSSFAGANCLIEILEDTETVKEGDEVSILFIAGK